MRRAGVIPGTTCTYNGVTDAGQEVNAVEVTHSTRVLMGVTCVEVIDTVFMNGSLEKLTHNWSAQDKQGNVWYFGEDAKQFSNGVVVSTAGSWLAGVNGGLSRAFKMERSRTHYPLQYSRKLFTRTGVRSQGLGTGVEDHLGPRGVCGGT